MATTLVAAQCLRSVSSTPHHRLYPYGSGFCSQKWFLTACKRPSSLSSLPQRSFYKASFPALRSYSKSFAEKQVNLSIDPDDVEGLPSPSRLTSLQKVIVLALLFISPALLCGHAQACESIKASSLGLKVASFLRQTGWPDEAIVFLLAMLPVLELRGAIPVGYWMNLDPIKVSALSILGNMVPVPFIILFMNTFAQFLSNRSSVAKKIVDHIFESTRQKTGPIQEFKWLGLMLFVAVPFPGTGAWTGAMAATILGMPFWNAVSANFLGVLMAGLLVNLLVNLGVKYAICVGIALFLVSTFMWSFLRVIVKRN